MAAAEYYYGTAGVQAVQNQHPPSPYPPQQAQYAYQQQPPVPQQQYNSPPPPNTPPPSYSPYPEQLRPQGYSSSPQQQHVYPANGRPPTSAPYPQTPPLAGPQKYPPPPKAGPPQQTGYLGVPAMPQRSHSQPPRVRFADQYESDDSSDRSYPSDSDSSRRRHRRRRNHRHSHSHSRYDPVHSYSGERDYDRRPEKSRRVKEHRDRDTFLGAGAGGIVGDLIFPGLGTAAGLLLGGYGGRKHAQRRSHSDAASNREYHRGRLRDGDGWDEGSATFGKGHAVR